MEPDSKNLDGMVEFKTVRTVSTSLCMDLASGIRATAGLVLNFFIALLVYRRQAVVSTGESVVYSGQPRSLLDQASPKNGNRTRAQSLSRCSLD